MSDRKKLSSNLTFFYKFVFPILLIGIIIVSNILMSYDFTSRIIMNLILLFISMSYPPYMNIKKVEYDSTSIFISNYRNEVIYELKDIKEIYQGSFFHSGFFNIIIDSENKKIKIRYLSRKREKSIFRMNRKPESVEEFENLLKK